MLSPIISIETMGFSLHTRSCQSHKLKIKWTLIASYLRHQGTHTWARAKDWIKSRRPAISQIANPYYTVGASIKAIKESCYLSSEISRKQIRSLTLRIKNYKMHRPRTREPIMILSKSSVRVRILRGFLKEWIYRKSWGIKAQLSW